MAKRWYLKWREATLYCYLDEQFVERLVRVGRDRYGNGGQLVTFDVPLVDAAANTAAADAAAAAAAAGASAQATRAGTDAHTGARSTDTTTTTGSGGGGGGRGQR